MIRRDAGSRKSPSPKPGQRRQTSPALRPSPSAPAPDVQRFVDAQEGKGSRGESYRTALAEIQHGEMQSCWIWYVFPQYLDRDSAMCQAYQIRGANEAQAYLQHEVLGARYLEISRVALKHLEKGVPVTRLLGGTIDAKKFHQSVSLFALAARSLARSDDAATLESILDSVAKQPYTGHMGRVDAMTGKRWEAEAPPGEQRVSE